MKYPATSVPPAIAECNPEARIRSRNRERGDDNGRIVLSHSTRFPAFSQFPAYSAESSVKTPQSRVERTALSDTDSRAPVIPIFQRERRAVTRNSRRVATLSHFFSSFAAPSTCIVFGLVRPSVKELASVVT